MEEISLSDKKILVTGASGFIGSHLCRRLSNLENEVVGISRKDQQENDTCSYWLKTDLKDSKAVERGIKSVNPDIIFHLASHVVGARDLERVIPTFEDNLASTVNILTYATQLGCGKIVLIGSMEEPEPSEQVVVPSSPYAAAKFAASAYGRMFHALYDAPVTIARLFMVYGPGQRDLKKLIPYVILSLLKNEVPQLSSGHRLVDWIYVDDVVDGLLATASTPNIEGKTINLGSGQATSIQDIVRRIFSLMATKVEPSFGGMTDRPMEQIRLATIADAKIKWTPKTSLEAGLQQTVAWYRLHFG